MSDVKWIKIVTDIFDDEKILLIEQMPDGYAIIVAWFKLLCLAGKQNNSGVFTINNKIPFTDEMFASIFRMQIGTIRLALTTFEQFGMIEIVNNTVTIPNWGKHQTLDKITQRNEYMQKYMVGYRDKQRLIASGDEPRKVNSKVNCKSNVNSTEEELDIDKEGDKSSTRAVKPPSARKFVPPTIDEVRAYCLERKNTVNPDKWMDHYISNGWMVGRNKMRDWKAAVRKWEGNDYGRTGQSVVGTGTGRDESEKLHSKYNGTVV